MGDILDLSTELGLVDKAGAWYSYKGSRLGQGREQSVNFLREHVDTAGELEGRIREHFGLVAKGVAAKAKAEAAAPTEGEAPRRRGRPPAAEGERTEH
jgi:recombination protein RecA